jgi:hypothetical protein
MNVRAIRLALTLVAVLVIAASVGFAGAGRLGFGRSSTKSFSVTLTKATKVTEGTVLQAGEYTIKFSVDTQSPEVEFWSDFKLVAKVQAKVEIQSAKNDRTEFETSIEETPAVLLAIDPAGLPEKLVFSEHSEN